MLRFCLCIVYFFRSNALGYISPQTVVEERIGGSVEAKRLWNFVLKVKCALLEYFTSRLLLVQVKILITERALSTEPTENLSSEISPRSETT